MLAHGFYGWTSTEGSRGPKISSIFNSDALTGVSQNPSDIPVPGSHKAAQDVQISSL